MKDRNTPGEDNHAAQVGCWGLVVGKFPRGDWPVQTARCAQSLQLESPLLGSGLGGSWRGTHTGSAARPVADVPADPLSDHRQVLHLAKARFHQLQNGDANSSLLTFFVKSKRNDVCQVLSTEREP